MYLVLCEFLQLIKAGIMNTSKDASTVDNLPLNTRNGEKRIKIVVEYR